MLKKLGEIVATSTVITQSFTQVQAQATSPDIWKEARDSYMEREHIVNNQITANNQVSMRRPGLKEQIRVLTEQLASVAERLGTVEADGAGNMDDVLERLGTVEADVGTNTSAIGALVTDVATNLASVGTLSTDVGTLKTDVATNLGSVGTLSTDVGTLKTDVGTLTSRVATNIQSIGTLGTDLDEAEAAIETVIPIQSLFEFMGESEIFPSVSNRRVTGYISTVLPGQQVELFAQICVDFLAVGSMAAPEVNQVIGEASLRNYDDNNQLTVEVTAPIQAVGDPTSEARDCVQIQWRGTCKPEVRRMLGHLPVSCTYAMYLSNYDDLDGFKIRGDNSYWGYKVFAAAETK